MIKNIIATRFVYRDIHLQKSVGIISEDKENQIIEIARPMDRFLSITPVTNPTSTALFKILITDEKPESHNHLSTWCCPQMHQRGCTPLL